MSVPQTIQATPTPFQALVQPGRTPDGKDVLALTLFTVVGPITVFLPPDGADVLARDLVRGAKLARTGLHLPNGRPVEWNGP